MSDFNIVKFFDDIHKSLEKRYNGAIVDQREKEAKILNQFFKKIQAIQAEILVAKQNNNYRALKKKIMDEHGEFLFEIARKALGRSTKTTFGKKASRKSENLELPMAKLIVATFNEVLKNDAEKLSQVALNKVWTGREKTNLKAFSLEGLDEEIKKELIKLTIKETQAKLQENGTYSTNIDELGYVQRAIKADISAMKIEYSDELIPNEWCKNAIKLLNIRSFSLKNYASEREVHLGSTDPWKSFSTVLSQLHKRRKDIARSFIIASKIKKDNLKNDINSHINHIRFVYELSGFGQRVKEADFLILNKPNTDEIYVRSTAKLINDYLQQKDLTLQLRSFALSQSVLKT